MKSIELIQNAGETVFVPSGWIHQVQNLDETLSVNANWINFANITNMLAVLEHDDAEARRATLDCKDMDDWEIHCQVLVRGESM